MDASARAGSIDPIVATSPDESSWRRAFGWLLVGSLVLRVAYAAVFPLDLAPDESYYWDWGRRPDLGYYSKPPMVGWLMAWAGWVGSDSFFVIKLFPAVLTTLALVSVFALAQDMYGARAGFWAATLMLATPANAALATFFTIDPPLFLFWSTSLWLAWRWWSHDGSDSLRPWLMAAVLGCGYLTKQIHLVFPVLLLVFLGVARSRPTAPRPWLVAAAVTAGSLVLLLPPVIWNWQHDWITLRHTTEELEHRPFDAARSVKFLGEFIGGQAGLGGGLTWILMVGLLVRTGVGWGRSDDRQRFLVLFAAPGLAAFLGLSVFQRVEQNWPLVFYPSLAVLVAGYASSSGGNSRRIRTLMPAAAGMGAALGIALMAVPLIVPGTAIAGSRSDPTARLRGWRQLAIEVERVRGQVPRPNETFILTLGDRYAASALAFYLPDQPRTYCWEDPRRPQSQYGIWGLPGHRRGWDALVVERKPLPAELPAMVQQFESWTAISEIHVGLGPQTARDREYAVFLGKGFRGPPETRSTAASPH